MIIRRVAAKERDRFIARELPRSLEGIYGEEAGGELRKAFLAKERKLSLGAVEGGRLIGVISLNIGYKVVRIGAFALVPARRGSGIGSRLLDCAEALAKDEGCVKSWLWTLPDIPAYRFYKKRGYAEEARLKRHFAGHDLCIMSKFLRAPSGGRKRI